MKKIFIYKIGKEYKNFKFYYQVIEKKGLIAKRFVMDQKSQKLYETIYDFYPNAELYQVITYIDYDERLHRYLKSLSN